MSIHHNVNLSEDAALRLAEAALAGDHDNFLDELRAAGMAPFLITVARSRHPDQTVASPYERGYNNGYARGVRDAQHQAAG